jgi:hypothetical protein
LKVSFYENKGKKGEKEEEKVYTAALKTRKAEQGQYTITLVATFNGKALTFKPDEYCAQRPRTKNRGKKIKIPSLYRQKTFCVQADRRGNQNYDEPNPMIHGFNTKEIWIHPNQKEHLKRWKDSHKKNNSK